MKSAYKILLFSIIVMAYSCHDTSQPNYQYMPNMYERVSYATYSESPIFGDGRTSQLPPAGTISRSFEVYEYPNTTEGYNLAKANLKSPLVGLFQQDMDKAKYLYGIYCTSCHGVMGDGQGKLVTQGKFLGVPNYRDRPITEGSVFHVETFGLNLMGSHANQLSTHERWLVAAYVMKLKSQL